MGAVQSWYPIDRAVSGTMLQSRGAVAVGHETRQQLPAFLERKREEGSGIC